METLIDMNETQKFIHIGSSGCQVRSSHKKYKNTEIMCFWWFIYVQCVWILQNSNSDIQSCSNQRTTISSFSSLLVFVRLALISSISWSALRFVPVFTTSILSTTIRSSSSKKQNKTTRAWTHLVHLCRI